MISPKEVGTAHLLPRMDSFKKNWACYLFGKNTIMESTQLTETYDGWTGPNKIIEREAARGMSIVGVQGMIKCN